MKLPKVINGWSNGNLTVIFQSYNPPTTMRWLAVWTDIFNVKHEIREFTRERLANRLAVYGMPVITFKRK